MTRTPESTTQQTAGTAGCTGRSRWLAAGVCALAGFCLFQFFGNATRGYVDTSSTFWWWLSQWLDPAAEAEHGWVILAISAWLLARNVRTSSHAQSEVKSEKSKWKRPEARGPELRADCGEIRPDRVTRAEARDEGVAAPSETPIPKPETPDWVAPAAMVAALGLQALGFVAQQTRISIVAVLLFTWGVLRLGGGRRWGSAAVFPLAFLVFAIPVNVLDSVGFWLRLWVVDAASAIAHMIGIEVTRSGTQLFAPDGRYQYDVAAACSGVRSLMALSALSLLIGYVNLRSNWRRAVVFGLCFPLTYLGNLARVLAIVVAAEWGGQAWGERMHDWMGFGVFVIVLGGVAAAARLLQRRSEDGDRSSGTGGDAMNCGRNARAPSRRFAGDASLYLAALAIVVLVAGEMMFLAKLTAEPTRGGAGVRLGADGRNPVDLPAFVGTEWIGRRAEVTALERAVLPADTGFSRRSYVHVQGAAHTVFFSIVLSGRDRTSIHRPEICLVGQGWTIRDARAITMPWREGAESSLPATLLRTELVEWKTGRRLPALTVYWFVNRDGVVATHWQRFWRDAWNRVRHGRADRWAYVLVQADAFDGEAAALARIQAVLAEVWPAVRATDGGDKMSSSSCQVMGNAP